MIVRQCPAMRLAGVLSLPLDTLDRCVITSSGRSRSTGHDSSPIKGVEADALPSHELTAGASVASRLSADQSPSVTAVREPPLYAAEEWPERRTTDRGERWPAVQDRFHSAAT